MKNGTETDVDCGGSCSAKCAYGKACSTHTDCVSPTALTGSANCFENRCQSCGRDNTSGAQYAGCTTWTDRTGATDQRSVAALNSNTFSPKCIKVKVGQAVTLTGDFQQHPVRHMCGPSTIATSAPYVTTFTAPGIYGFYCDSHGAASGSQMAGAIWVTP
jgi:plastocyanin